MKSRYSLILANCILLFALAFSFVSCDKVDKNGDLDGMWQLTEWKSLPDGEIKATKQQAIFYSVQLDLMKFSRYNDMDNYHLARFSHKGDSLIIGTVYARPKDDIVNYSALSVYGVPANGRFAISQLTSSKMVLKSPEATLTFRKY